MTRCLVTGGGGFIGTHLARALAARGDDVTVFDNRAAPLAPPTTSAGTLTWVTGDLRDADAVRRACAGQEVIFHEGAIASVPQSIADPLLTHAVNVTGTLHVLEGARAAGARRVVCASSCAIYGDAPELPKRESLPPAPQTPYAAQKLAAEEYCQLWARLYGLETVALRYFNVFGPGQDPASPYSAVIPCFIAAIQAGKTPVIYGDGEQARDFIYVADVVAANLLAAAAPDVSGLVLNIGTGTSIALNQVIAALAVLWERAIVPKHAPGRAGDIRLSIADGSLARERLGFAPTVPFSEGLRLTVNAARAPARDR